MGFMSHDANKDCSRSGGPVQALARIKALEKASFFQLRPPAMRCGRHVTCMSTHAFIAHDPFRALVFSPIAFRNAQRTSICSCAPEPVPSPSRRAVVRLLSLSAFGAVIPLKTQSAQPDIEDEVLDPETVRRRRLRSPYEVEFEIEEAEKWTSPYSTGGRPPQRILVGNGPSAAKVASVYLARAGTVGFVALFCMFGMAVSDRESGRVPLPDKYDPNAIANYFRIRPDRVLARLLQVFAESLRLCALVGGDRVSTHTDQMLLKIYRVPWVRGTREKLKKWLRKETNINLGELSFTPEWAAKRAKARKVREACLLREAITRLGPAAIKLGQAAASRPDLFDAAFVRELQKLQDNIISAFPAREAFFLIEKELGAKPDKIFDFIDPIPVAGASLGMVFRAQIEGVPVAVKVQRPGVAENIALDFYIVRGIVSAFRSFLAYRTELGYAVDEYATRLFEELDYTNEVANMLKFQRIYGDIKGIYIPKPFPMYSSRKVLVAEWVDGIKLIDENCKVRVEELHVVETGIRFALTQLLDRGFLHADMQNGNMLRMPSGDLALIDFGIVSEVPAEVRKSMVCALLHLIHGEYTSLAETCVGLSLMRPDDLERELPEFSAALREAFEKPDSHNQHSDSDNNKSSLGNMTQARTKGFTLIGVAEKLLQLGSRFPFVFSSYFLNNLGCLGMLEGLALSADPEFDVVRVVYPFVIQKMLSDSVPVYRNALEAILVDPHGRMRWNMLDQMLLDMRLSERSGGAKNLLHVPEEKGSRKIRGSGNEAQQDFDDVLLSRRGRLLRGCIMTQCINEVRAGGEGRRELAKRVGAMFKRAGLRRKLRMVFVFAPRFFIRLLMVTIVAMLRAVARRWGLIREEEPDDDLLAEDAEYREVEAVGVREGVS